MSRYMLLVTCVSLLIAICNAVPPVSKCKSDDAKCAKTSTLAYLPIFARGIPEVGVEPLDPVTFQKIDSSKANLKFILTDVTIVGLKNCQPKKVQRDVSKSKMFLKILCDATLDGQYELGGQVLVVPIEGKGKIHAELKKALINIDMDMAEKDGADGKTHWHIKSWSHTYELKDKSDILFENLFDGNEVLGRAAKELIANNGNDIVYEIGSPVIKTVVGRVVKNVNKLFHAVRPEDLSID